MSIMRWDPVREVASAQSQMRRLLESFFAGGESGSERASWLPAMDVREEDGQLVVEMELPGMKPDEIQIEVEDGALTVSGERREDQRAEDGRQYRIERRIGRFSRTIPLPSGVSPDEVQAEMRDGVLVLRIPRPSQPEPRRIAIQTREQGQSQAVEANTGTGDAQSTGSETGDQQAEPAPASGSSG